MTKEIKEFIHLKRAWYAKSALQSADYVDDVTVIVRGIDPDFKDYTVLLGESAMRWYKLERNAHPTPRLEIFSDALRTIRFLRPVINKLVEVGDVEFSPKEFCSTLEECGFKDITPTTR